MATPSRPPRERPPRPVPKASSTWRLTVALLALGMAALVIAPAGCVVSSEMKNHRRDLALQERGKTLKAVVIRSRGSGSALLVGAGWSEVQTTSTPGKPETYRIGTTLSEGTRVEILAIPEDGTSDRAEDVRARLDAWPFSRSNLLVTVYVGAPILLLAGLWFWKRKKT